MSSCLVFLGAAVLYVPSPISIFISDSMFMRRSFSSYSSSLLGSLLLISSCISLSISNRRASSLVVVFSSRVGASTAFFYV